MPLKRHEEIALSIQQRIRSRPQEPLPSIAALAAEYRVAYFTMWKALNKLAREKVLILRKGARTLPASLAAPEGSQDRFRAMVRARILDATWKTGEQLPKFAFFQSTFHVAQDTISRAIQALSREGLVHKRGKRWFVGPAIRRSTDPSISIDSRSRVALLLVPWHVDAHNFFTATHLHPFIANFTGELMKQNIRLSVVRQYKVDIEPVSAIAGVEKINELIDSLGDRYCGALLHDIGQSEEYFLQCLRMLLGWKKPAVFFDSHNNASHLTRDMFGANAPYYRLFFDEPGAVALAVETLVRSGHRVIGFPDIPRPAFPWVGERIRFARDAAARCRPRPNIVAPPHTETFWSFDTFMFVAAPDYLHNRITDMLHIDTRLSKGKKGRLSLQRDLLAATPSLASLFKDGATAIIAANDLIARDYYYWLALMGIDIPRHVSMISFDNIPEFITYPVSTIDFGFGRLGYLAAHLLINDIPVKADGQGRIPGIYSLVDRGSIAAPRGVDVEALGM
jgi:DNA-binding LacI/PurR family transcriptional regulator/DNA-binding transcriptional regulator YhcF (GntR family)